MTTQPHEGATVPSIEMYDRMRIALRHANVGVSEMADYLGVTRQTVGNWINGHVKPSRQSLLLWALRTGVPLEWIETGTVSDSSEHEKPRPDGPDGAAVRHQGLEPRTRWFDASPLAAVAA